MINQDEVFVITEDDILRPADKGKGKAGPQRNMLLLTKGAKGEKAGVAEETVSDKPAPSRPHRGGGRGGAAAASSLSLFVWGLGQFYNRDARLATLFVLCEILILAFHYFLYMTWAQIRSFAHLFFVSEWELMLYASSIDFCVILFVIYNVAQAYRAAEGEGGKFSGLRRPILSGLASFVVPGWGQLLNGQLGKGVVFLFFFLLQIYLLALYLLSPFYRIIAVLDIEQLVLNKARIAGMSILFATALSWLLSTYDAVLVARHARRQRA
jgi:hypothetical protein